MRDAFNSSINPVKEQSMKLITWLLAAILAPATLTISGCGRSDTVATEPLKILLISAHPDNTLS